MIKYTKFMDLFEVSNIPLCPKYADVVRPNILMFGDWNWNGKRATRQEAQYNKWIKQNKIKNIAIIEIGSGEAVATVKSENEYITKQYKTTKLIRINPRDSIVNPDIGYTLGWSRWYKIIIESIKIE